MTDIPFNTSIYCDAGGWIAMNAAKGWKKRRPICVRLVHFTHELSTQSRRDGCSQWEPPCTLYTATDFCFSVYSLCFCGSSSGIDGCGGDGDGGGGGGCVGCCCIYFKQDNANIYWV